MQTQITAWLIAITLGALLIIGAMHSIKSIATNYQQHMTVTNGFPIP